MSLLSTDTSILLLPGRAVMWHDGQSLKARRGEGWEGALASLETLLKQAGKVRGVRVGLSHHFASLHVFAPPAVRLPRDEMQGWLRERLAQDFGAEAESWRLAWQDVPPGRHVPVASMPAERLEALASRLHAVGASLKRLSPWFVTAWKRHQAALGPADTWLALVEAERLALARVARGHLIHVGMGRLEAGPADSVAAQVASAVARQALRLGVAAEGDVALLAPGMRMDGLLPGASPRLRLLDNAGWGVLLP